ncbi:hypothetical protein CBR_g50446 [Chara braunii]|uniref:DNA helicase n=1 Tax=Chara braunii TaxID=69332 RepID=A0A388M6Q5_CHABU|nr:hypothetical protein CBR_g50446 [Chara braunii]|eukprot:GBG90268.1 hypothetical protein CBR_g50446 [Chara braunii]
MMASQRGEDEDGDGGVAVLDSEYVAAFQQYVLRHHGADLDQLLLEEDDSVHYPLHIYYAELFESSPALATLLYLHPRKLLPLFDAAIVEAQNEVYNNNNKRHRHRRRRGGGGDGGGGGGNAAAADEDDEDDDVAGVKENVHARIIMHGSAADCLEVFPRISRIRCKDLARLITVKGTVIRTGTIKVLEAEREYECAKCQHKFLVAPELEQGNVVQLPVQCPSQRTNRCKGTRFKLVEGSVRRRDYQEVKIQEQVQALGMGSVPRSIPLVLEDDLVDVIKAGDDVAVTGVLLTRWRSVSVEARCDVDLVLKANNLTKLNECKSVVDVSEEMVEQFGEFWKTHAERPMKGRNEILRAICPQVFGLFTVKLAVALTLIGGVPRVDGSGTRIRGESHLLLVGDPGTGKSQFLKYAARLSHRSVMTTGLGSTTAGLTVTARKDGGDWVLEAGALVLGDGGLCCIDEFGGISEADRAAIHEAMEQQTLSVAKAGLVTTLNTRTTVFAVTNPKGSYDPQESLSVNCALSSPLLSRFDIVLVLLDTNDPDWDKVVSGHILAEHSRSGNRRQHHGSGNNTSNCGNPHSSFPGEEGEEEQREEEEEDEEEEEGGDGRGGGGGLGKKKRKRKRRGGSAPSSSSSSPSASASLWTIDRLRSYICYIRSAFQPVLTDEAEVVISGYYQLQRRDAARNAARTTIRLLESLIRLAHAHARLMFRNEVTRVDAVMAIFCVESSMTTSAILHDGGDALHSAFQTDPDSWYAAQEAIILERLGLRCGKQGDLYYDLDDDNDGGGGGGFGGGGEEEIANDELGGKESAARWKRRRPDIDDDDGGGYGGGGGGGGGGGEKVKTAAGGRTANWGGDGGACDGRGKGASSFGLDGGQRSVGALGMPGQLAKESIAEYRQRFQAQLALIEAEEQCQAAAEAAHLQAEAAAAAEKQRLQAEDDANALARRKEAQDLLQRHEATSVDKLKFWHFEPSEDHDDATPEEKHKEFLSKLVTRLPHCNVLKAQLRDYLHTAIPAPLMDAGVEVVDLHDYVVKIDHEFKTTVQRHRYAIVVHTHSIGEATCNALIDCGATRNYISQAFMVHVGLGPRVWRKSQPTLADGHTHKSIDRCIDFVPVYFTLHASEAVSFDILDTQFDMILCMSWLRSEDHPMNFYRRTVHVHDRNEVLVLCTVPPPHPSISCHVVSATSIRASITRDDIEEMGVCFLHARLPHDISSTDASTDARIAELLDAYGDVFETPHGVVPDRPIRHEIILEVGAASPRGCIYRMSEEELSVLRAQLDDLFEKGWIRPSSSPYDAPVLFVRKKNKDLRLCINYRKLNAQTVKNVGPLSRIDGLLERLGGAKFFSKLDLKSGYHQLESRQEDRYKTAFKTRYGHFKWLVMPFGLTNAPTTFQAAMTMEFRHMLDRFVLIYLDDILVYSRSLDEHVEHLRTVLERLQQAKYKANRDKCKFKRQELEYLGYFVTLQGIRSLADKIEAIRESGTKMKPSSARHPQTDGQTQRALQTAQMMLRTLIRPDQKDWVDHLLDIKFAYNTPLHPTISVTPFELHHGGRKGRFSADLLLPRTTEIDAACSPASARKYRELPTQARANMQKAQVRMQQQANSSRVPCPIHAGDLVWVSAEDFALKQDVSRKLLPKWFGPWTVLSAAGDEPYGPSFVIYIPPHLPVHPVFHASKLATYTPAKSDDFLGRQLQDLPSMDGHQEVDRITTDRKYGSKPRHYKVTFKAYDPNDTRWISGADLKASAPLIYAHYERQRLAKEASRPAPPTRTLVPPSDRQLRPHRCPLQIALPLGWSSSEGDSEALI